MKKFFNLLILLFSLFGFSQELANVNTTISTEIANDNTSKNLLFYRPQNLFENPFIFLDDFEVESIPVEFYTEQEIKSQKELNSKEEGIITFSSGNQVFYDRDIDNEEITPYTWKWVLLQVKEEDGSYTNIHLRRPNSWFIKNNATKIGDNVHINIPQIGIDEQVSIVKIYPNQLDTRLWDDNFDGIHITRPITGKIEHYVNNVLDVYFDDSNKPVSVTSNHLLWSNDRDDWVTVGELILGEKIKTKTGTITVVKKEQKPNWHIVYDLEVYRDHNFLVSDQYLLAHNGCTDDIPKKKTNGIYNVYDKDGVVIYKGKGGKERAKISMKGKDGTKVVHFEISQGIAGKSLNESAFILEYLDMSKNRPDLNRIESPGKKYFDKLNDSQKAMFEKAFKDIKSKGGTDVTPKKK